MSDNGTEYLGKDMFWNPVCGIITTVNGRGAGWVSFILLSQCPALHMLITGAQ